METSPNLFGLDIEDRTYKDQADLFDISLSGLHKWADEGYPLKGSLKEQIHWVRENRPLGSDKTLTEVRREKIQIEIELRRVELLIRKGELVRRADVARLFSDRVSIVRSGLINFHRVIEAKLIGRDLHEVGPIIKEEAMGLLEKYSRKSGLLLKGEIK
jgi:hypothetical protein